MTLKSSRLSPQPKPRGLTLEPAQSAPPQDGQDVVDHNAHEPLVGIAETSYCPLGCQGYTRASEPEQDSHGCFVSVADRPAFQADPG